MKKYIYLLLSLAILASSSCTDDALSKADYDFTPSAAALPTSVTVSPSNVGAFAATLSGGVTFGADTSFLQKGFVVSATADFEKERVLKATAAFQVKVGSLESGTTYYAKAYVVTYHGTKYSDATPFTTKSVTPILDLQTATSPLSDWETFEGAATTIDKDGDGYNWEFITYDEEKTQGAIISYSWYSNNALEPENYLLLPSVALVTDGTFLVTLEAANPNYPAEKVKLVISAEPITADNCANAEVLAEHTLEDGEPYTIEGAIPESYNNSTVYLGVAHYDCSDNYAVVVTGVKVVHVE
ncbi:MAG: hypothetical protein LBT94_02875 [Prevotellaceae bacterium]|jgi:hypothetical protein|nr:hypothetical protein [Prevotellaceae bacterium]